MSKLYTIGHSTHTLKEFLSLLNAHQIDCVVDVRTIPKSRYVPWFNKERLKASLSKEGIRYIHMAELGGLRKTSKDSINQGWHNASFRGYADYMQTPSFFIALKKLNNLLKSKHKVAIMCTEAVPWRCHRSLVSDAVLVRGNKVYDIMNTNKPRPHQLTSFAVVNRKKRPIQIYYPKDNKTM